MRESEEDERTQILHTYEHFPEFIHAVRHQCAQVLNTSFSQGAHDVTDSYGCSKPRFVSIPQGKAEEELAAFLLQQKQNPKQSACFMMGHKVAKSAKVYPLLKGMRLIAEGRKGVNTPFSYVVYHAPPKYRVSFAQAFVNKTLSLLFNIQCGSTGGVALLDSGATHSFVRKSFINSLGVKPSTSQVVDVQLADGQTMRSCGTVSLRLRFASGYVEQRRFIVCDTLLDGVDVILGEDFLKERFAIIEYEHGVVHLKPAHSSYMITLTPPTPAGQLGAMAKPVPKVISPVQAKRAMRKGAQGFWGVVKEQGRDSSAVKQHLYSVAVASSTQDNPWEEDPLATGLNSNSRHAIEGLEGKPDELKRLLLDFVDVFPEKLPELPPVRDIAHTIDIEPGHKPPCRPSYRLAPPELEECRKHVEELLSQGFIRPSASPYGSPILFVHKKDGSFRMVIDYRAVNNLTRKDKYPLPRIDDLLDKLQGAQFFSAFDLLSGYHQVRLHESDIPKTSFNTPFGSFEFLVLPFGLSNAPSTFQRLMNSIFHDFIKEGFVVVYLDDLLVFSKTHEDHLSHLSRVLSRLREHKLYAKLSKCEFFANELRYLGHIVGRDGIKVDPAKVKAIVDWPTPTCNTQVRSFLGLANYFRKFVQNYSSVAAPLTYLTGKVPWVWGEREQKAFQDVKDALSNAPVLVLPDPSKPYRVISDASDFGVGAVLLQEGKPVAYFSKKLNKAEQNYSTTEKELAGVLYALKEWRCYLLGQHFVVETDHKANSFLQSQTLLSPRRARWAEFLQQFAIEWEWQPGRQNPADPLSRCPNLVNGDAQAPARTLGEDFPLSGAVTMGDGGAADLTSLPAQASGVEGWARLVQLAQLVDPWLHRKQNRRKVRMREGLYRKGSRIYVPSHYVDEAGNERNLRREVLENLHGPPVVGHPGRDRTLELVSRSWWWPGVVADVADYVAHCDSCQRVKTSNRLPVGLLHPLEIPSLKWQSMSMDLITGLPKAREGFDAIWVAVDRLSKYAHFAPTTSEASAEDIAQLLRVHVFTLHGFPQEIVADRDPRWVSRFCKELFRLTGTRAALSTAFHPQTDGQTERVNRILEDYLRHYVTGRHTDWNRHLCEAEFCYNNTFQQSINTTPFRLTYGHDPNIPFQEVFKGRISHRREGDEFVPAAAEFVQRMRHDLERARVCLRAAQDRMKAYADRKRRDIPTYSVGQEVLLMSKNLQFKHSRTRKLLPRFIGPFPIVQVISPVAYKLKLPKNMKVHDVFHVSLLKEYKKDGNVQPPPPPDVIDGELEYEVEKVLAHRDRKLRGKKTKREYLVKWLGYEDIHNTWEPEEYLVHARDTLQQYWGLTTECGPVKPSRQDKRKGPKKQSKPTTSKRGRRA